jgi:hypothetical protein
LGLFWLLGKQWIHFHQEKKSNIIVKSPAMNNLWKKKRIILLLMIREKVDFFFADLTQQPELNKLILIGDRYAAEEKLEKLSSPPSVADQENIKKQDTDKTTSPEKQPGKDTQPTPLFTLSSSSGQAPPAQTAVAPAIDEAPVEGMVEMGGGLPALPPRPVAPERQAQVSSAFGPSPAENVALRVPQIKVATKPELTLPPGSDLGAVGKIGVFQIAHAPHAVPTSGASGSLSVLLWVYLLTFFVSFVLIKNK